MYKELLEQFLEANIPDDNQGREAVHAHFSLKHLITPDTDAYRDWMHNVRNESLPDRITDADVERTVIEKNKRWQRACKNHAAGRQSLESVCHCKKSHGA